MKIPIVMPTYNRPEFLEQVLAGLRKCDNLDLFKIFTSEEPGFPKVSALFDVVNFVERERHINNKKLGCNNNVLQAIDIGFLNNDFIVILEDDVVPGKDFLNLCLWGREVFQNDKEVFCITGFHQLNAPAPIEEANLTTKIKWFWPWGWATWKDRWFSDSMQAAVKESLRNANIHSWDVNLSNMHFMKQDLRSVYPIVPRTKNIGTYGTYCPSATWHAQNMTTQCFTDDNDSYFTTKERFKFI